MQSFTHVFRHAFTHTHAYTHTCIHTYIHAYIHTYTHTASVHAKAFFLAAAAVPLAVRNRSAYLCIPVKSPWVMYRVLCWCVECFACVSSVVFMGPVCPYMHFFLINYYDCTGKKQACMLRYT